MNVNFRINLNFKDQLIQEFLFDTKVSTLEVPLTIPNGYELNTGTYRENHSVYENNIPFSVREEFATFENGVNIGSNFFISTYGYSIRVSVRAYLILKLGLDATVIDIAKNLFVKYNFSTDGDLYGWIKNELQKEENSLLKENMFMIDSSVLLEKIGARITINDEQKQQFLSVYQEQFFPKKSLVNIVPNSNDKETTLHDWAEDMKISFAKIGEELLLNEDKPKETKEIQSLPMGTDLNAKSLDIINDILSTVVPSQCGEMKSQRDKLLTLFAWFEIKVEWRQLTIENDCFTIEISYPVILTRESHLVLYIYYAVPRSIGNTLLEIVKVCATRAALAGGVLGLALANPAAAIVVFKTLFGRCVEDEIIKCSNPGILTLKEIVNDWH